MTKDEAITQSIEILRDHCRVTHKAFSTEKTYIHWSRKYISYLYDSAAQIKGLSSEKKFEVWLTRMATDGCAAATQAQAFNAILCLYKHVFGQELQGVNALRAKRRKVERHAPAIEDISAAFTHVKDTQHYPARLILHLLYGCGLRVGEGISLRIKDVDFNNGKLFIHDSKHGKDRYVGIPETLVSPLRHQVEVAAMKARIDIANGMPVQMPDALHRKYRRAPFEVPWHFVFPKVKICNCPRRKIPVRYHVLDSTLQRSLKRAVQTAGILVPFTPPHLRHAYATHLIGRGASYKGVAKSMGHSNILTTFNYDHTDALTVGSPLDCLKEIIPFPAIDDIAASQ